MLGFLGARSHCEVARGTDLENFICCCKDGNVFALRPADRGPDTDGATLVAAARNLSAEQFIRSDPDAWLEHRASPERIMLIAAIAKARVCDGDLHAKKPWICGVPVVPGGKSLLACLPYRFTASWSTKGTA
jgi:hypothetical protein